ncbi:ribokinase [compost metagenome]
MLWYDETGRVDTLPSLDVPGARIVDTSGAGDVFHGAYVWSCLNRPDLPWVEHFTFARAASAHKIQHLGNEAGLPRVEDVERAVMAFTPKA